VCAATILLIVNELKLSSECNADESDMQQ